MHDRQDSTQIGAVSAVRGNDVEVRLRTHPMGSTVLVNGRQYRVGQIGGFVRIPLGYANLYAICKQVASAQGNAEGEQVSVLSVAVFGESIGGQFQRGVTQYPTVGDTVHLATPDDLQIIFADENSGESVVVGQVSASSNIAARLRLRELVSRHTAVVGSTGSGKSNFVATLLEALTAGHPSSRIVVIDPHGEYAESIDSTGFVFSVNPVRANERQLRVPFWALPFDELRRLLIGDLNEATNTAVRDEVEAARRKGAEKLPVDIEQSGISADAPLPFSLRQLWFDLEDIERRTFKDNSREQPADLVQPGDPRQLLPNRYPPPGAASRPPFTGRPRNIRRQLDFLKSRLRDQRYAFMLEPGAGLTPDLDGAVTNDLDSLVKEWIGHERAVSVFDLSEVPGTVMPTVVGAILRILYDVLYWAQELPVGGRERPLFFILDEAHLILRAGEDSPAHRSAQRIAKEGRKYGVGLMVVSQRPTELEPTVLSQCGTVIAMRLSNTKDRSAVQAMMPDDLGDLASILPSLRTGEGFAIGEAVPVPTRILFRRAQKLKGGDPNVGALWGRPRDVEDDYAKAIDRWRNRILRPKHADNEEE